MGVLEEISKISQNLQGRARVGVLSLRPVVAFKKNKVKITRSNLLKRDAYTETVTQVFSVNFEKSYEHDYSTRLPLK